VGVSDIEILARVERRRKWSAQDKAALLAEVEAAVLLQLCDADPVG
jgi:hypothetical protein